MSFFLRKKTFVVASNSNIDLEELLINNNIIQHEYTIKQKESNKIVFTPVYHLSFQRVGSLPNITLILNQKKETKLNVICEMPKKFIIFDTIYCILLFIIELMILWNYISNGVTFDFINFFPAFIPFILCLALNIFLQICLVYYSRKIFNFYYDKCMGETV